jgi:predicted small lipoprotein YifL
MTLMRPFCLSILLCLLVTACGTKGPLYIPERQYPQDAQPSPTPQVQELPEPL